MAATDRIARFCELKARFPASETPRFSLAQALAEGGRHAEAAAELAELVALKPDYCVAWLLYGRCLVALDRAEDARQALLETMRIADLQGHREPKSQASLLLDRLDEGPAGD